MSAASPEVTRRLVSSLPGLLVLGAFCVEVLTVIACALAARNGARVDGAADRLLATWLSQEEVSWALVAAPLLFAVAAFLHGAGRVERSPRLASILKTHALVALTILLLFAISALESGPRLQVAGLLTAGTTAIALATWAAIKGLRALPEGTFGRTLGAAAVLTVAGLAASQLVDLRPVFLQRLTLAGVDALAHLVFEDVSCDLDRGAVGTRGFRVRVAPDCSGVEGICLGLALVVPYLILARGRLRFPRALLLPPLLLLSLFLVNVARIVLILHVGRAAPREALIAFHTSIGWLLFVLSIAVFIPFWESVLRLRPDGGENAGAYLPDAGAYLVPFISSSGIALAASLASEPSSLSLLRYPAGVVALLLFPVPASERRAPVAAPALVGAAVAALYLVATFRLGGPGVPSLAGAWAGGSGALAASLIAVLGYAVVTPVVEELAFRGYLMRRLAGRVVADVRYEEVGALAIALSSLAFGVLHRTWWLGTVAGLAFALSARRFGGLAAAVTSHVAANTLIAMVALALDRPDLLR